MRLPGMVLFDYGQTLIDEIGFDLQESTEKLLQRAVANPQNATAEEICSFATALTKDIGYPETLLEIPNRQFRNYLYEYFGIEFTDPPEELERIFFGTMETRPTEGMLELLEELRYRGVRLAVVSNISISGDTLRQIIARHIPVEWFDFILASSDYIFRKPHPRLFELALRKAGLLACEVWFCGDNPVCDIEGAAAAGMTPFWYQGAARRQSSTIPRCEYNLIRDWAELRALLGVVNPR